MSTTIDEKVVEMRFDNRDFEHNIKDTMKTLDEFKKQLNFSGASDGLENVSQYANKINFNSLGKAIDTINERFSTLGIMGMTALHNITNTAMSAGKRIVDSLTIAPIKSGYDEYELTLNTIKTVMNATNRSAKDVKAQLKSLDDYADKTIYSTGDMFNNISKFTNVGVPLEDASTAMIGIANATALAGRGAREASIAMYNLGQAIGVGYLNRIDYKSLQNAGIDTNEWKEAMIDAALAAGTLTKAQDGMYKSGDKLFTMQNLFIDGLQTQWATRDVMMKVLTDYGSTETEIGKKAWKAAQEVRTFSGMMEALKASVGTGWKETWELLFGDLDKATNFWTRINDFVSGIIGGFTKKRNEFLQGVLDPINPLLEKIGASADAVKETVDTVSDYVNVVDEIISGKWGSGQSRWDALTKAGYDWAHAQNLVNEKLGSSVRHATNFSESQEKIVDSEGNVISETGQYIQSLTEMDDATLLSVLGDQKKVDAVREIQRQADRLGLSVGELVDKSDELSGRTLIIESMANIGNSLTKIFESVGKAWTSAFPPITTDTVYDIVTGLYKLSNIIKNYVNDNAERFTRTLKGLFAVLSVIGNIVKGVLKVGFTALKGIFSAFGKTSSGVLEVTANLGDVLVLISNILNNYIISAFETVINMMNSGIGSIRDWITNNTSLGEKFEWLKNKFYETINTMKEYLTNNDKMREGLDKLKNKITEVKNNIVDWFNNNEKLNAIYNTLSGTFDKFTKSIKDFIENNETLKNLFEDIHTKIDNAKTSLEEWFTKLSEGDSGAIGKNIIDGIANGITYAAGKIWDAILTVAQKIKDIFFKFFDMGSPSKETENWGRYIIDGLCNGIQKISPKFYEAIRYILDQLKTVSFSTISSVIWPLSTIIPQLKFLDLPRQFLNLFSACGYSSVEGLEKGLSEQSGLIGKVIEMAQHIISIFKGEIKSNSPSKVFIAIGGFIISGLIIGMTRGFENVPDIVKGFADKIIAMFKNITLGKIIGVGVGVGIAFLIHEIAGALTTLGGIAGKVVSPLTSLSNAFNKVGTSLGGMFSTMGVAKKKEADAALIKGIGASILMIAAAMYIVAKINTNDLKKSAIVVGVITAVVIAMAAFASFLSSKFPSGGWSIVNNSNSSLMALVALAGAILLFALAIKAIAMLNLGENAEKVIWRLIGILGFIVLLMLASKLAGQSAWKAGSMILKTAIALLLIIKVIKAINELTDADIDSAVDVMKDIAFIFGNFIVLSKFAGKYSGKTGFMLLSMASSMLIMVKVIKALIELDNDDGVDKAIGVIRKIAVMFGALIIATHFAGKGIGAAALMLGFTMSIYLMIGAVKLINTLTQDEITKAAGIILAVGGVFAALMVFSRFSSGNALGAAAVMLSFTLSLYLIIGAISLLSLISDDEVKHAGFVIGQIGIMFAILLKASQYAEKSEKSIYAIAISLAILVGAIALLTLLDQKKLMTSAGSVSVLMLALAALMKSLGNIQGVKGILPSLLGMILVVGAIAGILKLLDGIDSKGALMNAGAISIILLTIGIMTKILNKGALKVNKNVIGSLATMIIVIGLIAGILKLLDGTDSKGALANAAAIAIILGAMTLTLSVLKTLPNAKKSIGALVSLGVIIGIIGGILKLLDGIDAKGAILNALAISELLAVMTIVLLLLSTVKTVSTSSLIAIGALTLVVGALAGILGAMQKFNVQPSLETAESLSLLLAAMSASLVILSLVGMMGGGTAAIVGVLELIAVVTALITFTTVLGLLNEAFPDMEKFIENGGKIFAQIGSILGDFIGNLLAGMAGPMIDLLPKVGEKLSEFMDKLTPFLNGVKNVGDDTLKGASFLALAILEITAAELLSGITSFITGGHALSELGTELTKFMINALPFFMMLSVIGPDVLSNVKNLADAILAITKAEFVQGINNLLGFGENSLENFGSQLGKLGRGLNEFASELTSFGPESSEVVKSACEAIKLLAETNEVVPNTGGFLSNILGDNRLDDFGIQLVCLGLGLADFVTTLKGFNQDSVTIVDSACQAIQKLGDANKYVQNTGGFISFLIGDNNLGDFGNQISQLGNGLASFVLALRDGGFENGDTVTLVDNACKSIEKIAGLNQFLSDDKWFNKLIGNSSLESFAKEIPKLATGINDFVKALPDFSAEKLEVVRMAIDALLAIGSLGALDLSNIATNMLYFSGSLSDLGVGISTFFNTLTEIGLETIQEGIGKVNELIAMASTIAETNIEQVSVFSDSLVKVANEGVKGFCDAFDGDIPKIRAKQAVVKMLISALSGAVAMKPLIIKEFNAIAEGSVTKLRSFYQAFFDAGRYLTQGFADGIRDNIQAAVDAATDVGKAAATALANATQEESPSKLTHKMGVYFSEGFAIGIKEQFGKVYNTAFNAGDMAKEGLSNAIAKISQMVEDGIDTSPTIRPVLDLSEVEQGASYLGSMFGTNSIGLKENINSISNGFNSRIQNGSGLDLLNAINKLEATVRGSNGNTLNIYTQELDSEKLDQIVRHVNKELGVIF